MRRLFLILHKSFTKPEFFMRGGGSWLPLLWLMVAFLVIVKAADMTLPILKNKFRRWQMRKHNAQEQPQ